MIQGMKSEDVGNPLAGTVEGLIPSVFGGGHGTLPGYLLHILFVDVSCCPDRWQNKNIKR